MLRPLYTLEYRARWGAKNQRRIAVLAGLVAVGTTGSMLAWAFAGGETWKLVLGALGVVGMGAVAFSGIGEVRDLERQYADFLAALPDADYTEIEVDSPDAAAELVAAVARRVYEPEETFRVKERRFAFDEEVEIASIERNGKITLYLNAGARQRCAVAGIPLSGGRAIKGAGLPKDRIPVLVGEPAKPLAPGDVRKLLKS